MRIAPACLGILLTIIAIAPIIAPTNALAGVPHISILAGYNTYAMNRVNEIIADLNDQLAAPEADKIDSGFLFGVGFGMTLDDGFTMELAYQRLNASTAAGNADGQLDFSIPGNALILRGAVPVSGTTNLNPLLGLGAGLVSTGGEVMVVSSEGDNTTYRLSGTSVYLEATIGVAIRANRSVWIDLGAGYRHAEIDNAEPQQWRTDFPDLGAIDVDYSGLTARLGVRLLLQPGED